MQVSVNIRDELVREKLAKLEEKQNDWTKELYDSGVYMLRSMDLNFANQGRPVRWKEIKRQGMILQDTGRLRRSVTSIISDTKFLLGRQNLTLGTNVEYAKYLQKERPFLLFQREDIPNIISIFRNSIQNL